MAVYIADRRLWLDAEGNVVEDGDPTAHSLLCTPGKKIPEALAVRLGLMAPSGGGWVADRRLFLTADGLRVVEEGDPEASTLWITPGKVVPRDVALKHGLLSEPEREQGLDLEPEPVVLSEVDTREAAEPDLHEDPEPEPPARRRR